MRRLLGVVLGLFLACCQENGSPVAPRVAGGSAVEGETITARLLAMDGTSLARARVHATSPDLPDWSLDVVSDSVGSVRIVVPSGARLLVLQVESDSWGGKGPIVFRIPLRPSLDTTLTQERWGALRGRITLDTPWRALRVVIAGLSQVAAVHEGSFEIAHLPPGTWPVSVESDSQGVSRVFDLGTATMPIGGADVYRDFAVDRSSTFRMDFEDSADVLARTRCVEGAQLREAARPPSDCRTPDGGSGSWEGASLWTHLVGTAAQPGGLEVSLARGGGYPVVDVADSLRFMAMGTGNVRLVVALRDGSGRRIVEGPTLSLHPTWSRVAFPLSPWLAPGVDPVSVSEIYFVVVDETWLVLDRLEFSSPRR